MTKYKVGDLVVHGHEIGRVTEIIKDFRGQGPHYRIQAVSDDSLFVTTPVDQKNTLLRSIINKKDAEEIIDEILSINCVELEVRNAEAVYNDLIRSGDHRDMVRLIKTSYEKCADKAKKGMRSNEKDKLYLRLGEKLLYSEFAVALNKSFDETKEYVMNRVQAIESAA